MSLQLYRIKRTAVSQRNYGMDCVSDCLIGDRQCHCLVDDWMCYHDRFDLTQLNSVAACLNHVVFATDEQIIALLIKGHPITGAIKVFHAADSEWIADKAGCTFFRPSVVALHHYGASRVEQPLLPRSGDFSAFRVDGDQGSIAASFPNRDGRKLFRRERFYFVEGAYIRLRWPVKVRISWVRKLLHERAEVFGRKDFTGKKNQPERA